MDKVGAGLRAALAAVALTASAPVALPAGAIAIGECDRHGYTVNFYGLDAARNTALKYCASNGDHSCEVVVTVRHACGAFAVDGHCKARGWAYAGSRYEAEKLALHHCHKHGGHDCAVRRWICDTAG